MPLKMGVTGKNTKNSLRQRVLCRSYFDAAAIILKGFRERTDILRLSGLIMRLKTETREFRQKNDYI